MALIKRFIECLVPVTSCNMKCSYCYVVQNQYRTERLPDFRYSPERIGEALSIDRLGGVCYISICGAGETLIPREMPDIIRNVLLQGHHVNVTTNGTINPRFEKILALPKDMLERLHFAFSFHYLELLRIKKLGAFFSNVKKVREAGCSFTIQLNLYDGYIPHLEEIKNVCLREAGAAPQVVATRSHLERKIALLTKYSAEEYGRFAEAFRSPLFDFTMKNFLVKRKEFCYAGDWSLTLNLATGLMTGCYMSKDSQNIFANIQKPIRFRALGNNCHELYCINSSHFVSLGVIPQIPAPSYADLRDRPQAQWYTHQMRAFLSGKLGDNNLEYTSSHQLLANVLEFTSWNLRRGVEKAKKLCRRSAARGQKAPG